MKVRHKATGVELEVRVTHDATSFYELMDGSLIRKESPDWQLVPDVVWDDCTGEVEIFHENNRKMFQEYFVHNGKYVCLANGYRLRKIDGLHHGPAFIVERRKER